MGCFDIVTLRCPACNHRTDYQTKAALNPSHKNYFAESASPIPGAIIDELTTTEFFTCEACGQKFTLTNLTKPHLVASLYVEDEDYEEDDD